MKTLLLGGSRTVGITAPSPKVSVQGMGGIGKSVLAAALARDGEIREAFPDGVVWVDVGQKPELVMLQAQLADFFEDHIPDIISPQQGKSHLSKLLADKACLLIVDDVWKVKHAAAFDALGPEGRLLISTRQQVVVSGMDAEELRIDLLSEDQALELLRRTSRTPPGEPLPEEAAAVAMECGHLPLALAMIGTMVRGKPRDRWRLALQRLRDTEIEKIKSQFAYYPYPDLFKALHVSVEALPPEVRDRYLDLAVFPEDFAVPEAVFKTFWAGENLGGREPVEILDLFIESSLAHRGHLNGIALHDLQHDYVRRQTVSQVRLHNRLLDAYARRYPGGWETGPDDGYYFRFLIPHLLEARRLDEAGEAARALLGVRGLHPLASIRCLRFLGGEAADVARNLARDKATHYAVICWCLNFLGEEARSLTGELLADRTTHFTVLCRCLTLMGEEAKDDAKRLIKDATTHPFVLCRCLELVGEEAKDDAKRLIKDATTHPFVLCRCLELVGEEAKDDAKRLIKQSKAHEVLCRCLELLGEEAKDDAKRLIKQSKVPDVLCRCLTLLGEEAKDDAKRLIKQSKAKEVLCRCLKLLGEEAKDDAKRLINEGATHPSVLSRCLDLLGEEATSVAVERLRSWKRADPALLVRCFQIAGGTPEARKASEEMLGEWNRRVPIRLRVAALRAPFDSPLRIRRAREVLANWLRENRPLVAAALAVHWDRPEDVTEYCRAILRRWHAEIEYQVKKRLPRYEGHIWKALTHPALRQQASRVVENMLTVEARRPGFLGPMLHEEAQNILQGQWPPWSASEADEDGNARP